MVLFFNRDPRRGDVMRIPVGHKKEPPIRRLKTAPCAEDGGLSLYNLDFMYGREF